MTPWRVSKFLQAPKVGCWWNFFSISRNWDTDESPTGRLCRKTASSSDFFEEKKNEDSFLYVLKYVSCYITVDATAYYESVKTEQAYSR